MAQHVSLAVALDGPSQPEHEHVRHQSQLAAPLQVVGRMGCGVSEAG